MLFSARENYTRLKTNFGLCLLDMAENCKEGRKKTQRLELDVSFK